MPCNKVHVEGFLLGEREHKRRKGEGEDRSLETGTAEVKWGETERQAERRKGERDGGRQGPFKGEHNECA